MSTFTQEVTQAKVLQPASDESAAKLAAPSATSGPTESVKEEAVEEIHVRINEWVSNILIRLRFLAVPENRAGVGRRGVEGRRLTSF